MPGCCVLGCGNSTKKGKTVSDGGLHFYCIPVKKTPFEEKRREDWIKALSVNRVDWKNWSYDRISTQRVCSKHFISGKRSDDQSNPDWVPNVFQLKKSKAKQEATLHPKKPRQRKEQPRKFIQEAGLIFEDLKYHDYSSVHHINKSAITNGLIYELLTIMSVPNLFEVFANLCGHSIEESENSKFTFMEMCNTLTKERAKFSKSTFDGYKCKVFDFPYEMYPLREICTDTNEPSAMPVVSDVSETISSSKASSNHLSSHEEKIATFLKQIAEPRLAVTRDTESPGPVSFSVTCDTEVHESMPLPIKAEKICPDGISNEAQTSSLQLAGDVEENQPPYRPIKFILEAGFNYDELKRFDFSSIHSIDKSRITNGLLYELSTLEMKQRKLFDIFSIMCSSTIALPAIAYSMFMSRFRTMKKRRSCTSRRKRGYCYKPFDFPYEEYFVNYFTPLTPAPMPTTTHVSLRAQETSVTRDTESPGPVSFSVTSDTEVHESMPLSIKTEQIYQELDGISNEAQRSSLLLAGSIEENPRRPIKFILEAGFNYEELKRFNFSSIHTIDKSQITNGLLFELSTLMMTITKLFHLFVIMCNNSVEISKKSVRTFQNRFRKMKNLRRRTLPHRPCDRRVFNEYCYKVFDFPYEDYPANGNSCTQVTQISMPTTKHVSIPTTTPVSRPTTRQLSRVTTRHLSRPTTTPVSVPTNTPVSRTTTTPVPGPKTTHVPTTTPVFRLSTTPVFRHTTTSASRPTTTPVSRLTTHLSMPTCTHLPMPTSTPLSVHAQESSTRSSSMNAYARLQTTPQVSNQMLVPVTFLVPVPLVEPFRASVESHVKQTMNESAKKQITMMPYITQLLPERGVASMTLQIPKTMTKPPLIHRSKHIITASGHAPVIANPSPTKRPHVPMISVLHTLAAKSKRQSISNAAPSPSASHLHPNNIESSLVCDPMTPLTTVNKTLTPRTVTIAAQCSTSVSQTPFFKNIPVVIRMPSLPSSLSTPPPSSLLWSPSQSSSPSAIINDHKALTIKSEQVSDSITK